MVEVENIEILQSCKGDELLFSHGLPKEISQRTSASLSGKNSIHVSLILMLARNLTLIFGTTGTVGDVSSPDVPSPSSHWPKTLAELCDLLAPPRDDQPPGAHQSQHRRGHRGPRGGSCGGRVDALEDWNLSALRQAANPDCPTAWRVLTPLVLILHLVHPESLM